MIAPLLTLARFSRVLLPWVVVVPIGAHWLMRPPEPAWRVRYYDNAELLGTPNVTAHELRLDARWGNRSPHPQLPADNFSARWDSCMRVDHDGKVALQVTSEGRARLYVDHKLIVEDWQPHRIHAVGGMTPLSAGWHHVRVQYANESGPARIALAASFDNEVPATLTGDRLVAPSNNSDAPCRGLK